MNMHKADREHLVVVGNGMAGMRTVEELLKRAPGRYAITVIGAEPHVNYDRIMLSSVLAGEKEIEQIIIHSREWYAVNNIELITSDAVVKIDTSQKAVTSTSGRVWTYDKLLLATGSRPIAPPIPGLDLTGVCAFRDIADIETMITAASTYKRAIVIGGGLLGLEAANGLLKRGMQVAVVHLMDILMERQLDREAAGLLKKELDERGINFFTNGQTEQILGQDRVEGVVLADGRTIPGDLVVLAIGIRPNVELAQKAGLIINRGIEVGDDMRTSDPNIFAVGECVEHRGKTYGLVAPIWDMAKVCADHLAGDETTVSDYVGTVLSTRLKVTGIDMFSAGDFQGDESTEEIVFRDPARQIYKRLIVRDDRLVGGVLFGDTRDAGWYFQLLKEQNPLGDLRDTLIFGQSFALPGLGIDPSARLAALSDEAEICGCNGVSKGTILATITGKSLTSVDEIRAHCKASASCGSCTGQVEGLLSLALGDAYVAATVEKPMCKCTRHGHDSVRREIIALELKSIPAVLTALDWLTPDGCHSCRPALNFYLLIAWPGEYRDDAQSRFVNERMHANIQKDGTFSVIPRMWGGVTSAKELRAIADVVDKFDIPTVKVTGGQRIDLLGVKREQLPAVWRDLNNAGMVSGHAYGKALRTVKTCVGSEWCRFGTQDSTAMGVTLERMTWGSWHPHKVKLAVSGCPRNCAESTIKDFGVIAVESGWEIHVGGNGGIKVRVTDFLCKVTTDLELLEYCGAFLQLYREEARYLERTAHWIERVGIDRARSIIVDDADQRRVLYARFLHAQTFAQDDPWAERTQTSAPKSLAFRPMEMVG